jgi:hypothetical protein
MIPPVVVSASAKCQPRWRRCIAIVSSSDTAGSFSKDVISGVHAVLSLRPEQVHTLASQTDWGIIADFVECIS